MEFQGVKGTRDFYPDDMRVRNWIVDAWRRVSLRNGFEEYDSPIFEYLDLFTVKSGQEIAGQLFNFVDRGGRQLAIRPEITPSLARMVNAKINSLPRPIKWFSTPRLCRAENPQKGRLREFFQWNVDVIGADSILADAECIYVAADLLRELGLSADDVCVRIGSRPLTIAALRAAGVPAELTDAALAVLDKRPKLSEEDFARIAREAGLSDVQIVAVGRFQQAGSVDELREYFRGRDDVRAGVEKDLDDLAELFAALSAMGAGDYCTLDLRVVRGLAYYTGVVYEVFDRSQSLRAVAGGGRYDNLLEVLGGPKVGATGFGMGDVVLGILLAEKGTLPALGGRIEYFVIEADEACRPMVLEVVGALRRAGLSADFNYRPQALGKQLKAANRRGAGSAVIVRADGLTVKDLASGSQREVTLAELLKAPAVG
jgi:histidyl-tRNA synthetase